MLTGFNLISIGKRAQDTLPSQMMRLLHLALTTAAFSPLFLPEQAMSAALFRIASGMSCSGSKEPL